MDITPVKTSVYMNVTKSKATGTLTSNNTNVTNGKKVTIGSSVYTFKTNITAKVRATQTLTISDKPHDGDTITIGSTVYTYKTTLSPDRQRVANEVLIGATAAASLDNLKDAINCDTAYGKIGTTFSRATVAHTLVTATTNTDTTQVIQAIAYGTGGNSIATTETHTHGAWGDAVMAGGVAGVPNEVKIGADADATLANLKLALIKGSTEGTNYGWDTVANADVTTGNVTAHAVLFTAVAGGVAGNITSTTDETTLSWTAATLTGGGGTVGKYTITKPGKMTQFVSVAPQWTGSPTYTISIADSAGNTIYTTGALNENATTTTAKEIMLAAGDVITVTTNAAVEDTTLPLVLHIR